MPLWELATKENWELILTERRTATIKTQPTSGKYFHNPIAPIYTTPNSHVLLIGTHSKFAKSHWFLGARVSQYLYVSPSMNSNLISGVQTSDIKRVGLNRLTLIKFEDYGVYPYTLQLEIPRWLEDIYIEVWEYTGIIDDPTYQYDVEEILERLDRIEAKLNSSSSPRVNSSSNFNNPDSSAHLGII